MSLSEVFFDYTVQRLHNEAYLQGIRPFFGKQSSNDIELRVLPSTKNTFDSPNSADISQHIKWFAVFRVTFSFNSVFNWKLFRHFSIDKLIPGENFIRRRVLTSPLSQRLGIEFRLFFFAIAQWMTETLGEQENESTKNFNNLFGTFFDVQVCCFLMFGIKKII